MTRRPPITAAVRRRLQEQRDRAINKTLKAAIKRFWRLPPTTTPTPPDLNQEHS